jgi:hypothetical protein
LFWIVLKLLVVPVSVISKETSFAGHPSWDYISQAQLLRSHQALKLGFWDHISQAQLLGPHLKHSCWDHICQVQLDRRHCTLVPHTEQFNKIFYFIKQMMFLVRTLLQYVY